MKSYLKISVILVALLYLISSAGCATVPKKEEISEKDILIQNLTEENNALRREIDRLTEENEALMQEKLMQEKLMQEKLMQEKLSVEEEPEAVK